NISFTQEVKSPTPNTKGLAAAQQDTIKQLFFKWQKEADENSRLRKQLAELDSTLIILSEESSSVATKLVELCAIIKYDSNRNYRSWSKNEIERLLNYLNNLCGATESWRNKTQQSKLRFMRPIK
ncbi:MAG: hypothetical protein ACKOE6_10615, partial [Flammeovirgaceae bacterium]